MYIIIIVVLYCKRTYYTIISIVVFRKYFRKYLRTKVRVALLSYEIKYESTFVFIYLQYHTTTRLRRRLLRVERN